MKHINLATYKIKPGDVLRYTDAVSNHTHTIEVISCIDNATKTKRSLTFRVEESTDKDSIDKTYALSMGMLPSDNLEPLTAEFLKSNYKVLASKLMADDVRVYDEIKAFLLTRHDKKFGAKFDDITKHIISLDLYEDIDYAQSRKRVVRVIHKHPSDFRFSGGWAHLNLANASLDNSGPINIQPQQRRPINKDRMWSAIMVILEELGYDVTD